MGAVARPILKMAGGKTKLLHDILKRLPRKINTYYEPFVGGGAVFFALAAEKRFDKASLSDLNEELVNVYRCVAADVSRVIYNLEGKEHSKEAFYRMRALRLAKSVRFRRAARMIYLNKTCFNGLYRVNQKGEFNVPFGDYENPKICDEAGLRAAAKAFEGVALAARDFERVVDDARRGDAVYFDPPYVPVSATANFTAYTKDGFGPDDQERLRDLVDKLDARGVHVLLSNADTREVRKLYDGFRVEKVSASRAINSKGDKRGKVGELLISGKRV